MGLWSTEGGSSSSGIGATKSPNAGLGPSRPAVERRQNHHHYSYIVDGCWREEGKELYSCHSCYYLLSNAHQRRVCRCAMQELSHPSPWLSSLVLLLVCRHFKYIGASAFHFFVDD